MEVFAGFGEYTDTEIGRLVDAIGDLGQLDNTLVFYIVGDNGASAEGGMAGMFNEMTYFNGVPETVQSVLAHYDELGGPNTYGHYAAGWAVAGDTPFTWTKQVASSYGGTRNGLVVHWPKGITAKNEVRSQWHHVIDVAPTMLAAAKLPEPKFVDGSAQVPIEGVSMLPTFNDAKAPERHLTQYFEIFGNRAHLQQRLARRHRAPRRMGGRSPAPRSTTTRGSSTTRGTTSAWRTTSRRRIRPSSKEMQALFLKEAVKYRVLPIDDRTLERTNASLVGRPDLMGGRTSLTVYDGMIGMSENVFINAKNRSHSVTAEVTIPAGGANGVIIAQAGRFGGWSLYLKDGKPAYTYNFLGLERFTVAAATPVAPGKATIRFEFAYDGGGLGKGGVGTIIVNGQKVAEGRIERTQAMIFSADEGADVGEDGETPVVEDYGVPAPYKFTGTIA